MADNLVAHTHRAYTTGHIAVIEGEDLLSLGKALELELRRVMALHPELIPASRTLR